MKDGHWLLDPTAVFVRRAYLVGEVLKELECKSYLKLLATVSTRAL
jgi:hypothetical protein